MTREFKSRVLFISTASAATIASVAILWNARFLVLLLMGGLILALLLQTVMGWLQKLLKVRYGAAYALTLVLLGALLTLLSALRGPALLEQLNELRKLLPGAVSRVVLDIQATQWGSWLAGQISDQAQVSRAVSFLLSGIGGATVAAVSLFGGLFIVLMVGLYVSAEPDFYNRGLKLLVPSGLRASFDGYTEGAVRNLRFWLLARLLSMAVIGSLVAGGLWVLGIPLAGTLGLITAVLTFIPNFGPVLSAIPVLLIALTLSPMKLLLALAVLCGAHFLEGNLVTPLMDRGIVKLPPALTLAMQCFLGSVAGLAGVALAAPILAVILGAVRQRDPHPAVVVPIVPPEPHSLEPGIARTRRLEVKRFRRGTTVWKIHKFPSP